MAFLLEVKTVFNALNLFVCLFFAVFLLTSSRPRRRPNGWLTGFLLVMAALSLAGLGEHISEARAWLWRHAPWFYYADTPLLGLYAPFLLFYVRALCGETARPRLRDAWQALPFLALTVLVLLKVLGSSAAALRQDLLAERMFHPWELLVQAGVLSAQMAATLASALSSLARYRRRLRDYYSDLERINLAWLRLVLAAFAAWTGLVVVEYAAWPAGRMGAVIAAYIAGQAAFLGFVSLMVFRGLRQPAIFLGEEPPRAKRRYENALLPAETRDAYKERVIRYMEESKPYLNPLLSLPQLASQLKIPVHHLSQLLNVAFGRSFFDFVNGYRVRESQRLLSAPGPDSRTVLDVLYETGFNSKSVFNTAFKKHTGMTPSEYRRRAVQDSDRA